MYFLDEELLILLIARCKDDHDGAGAMEQGGSTANLARLQVCNVSLYLRPMVLDLAAWRIDIQLSEIGP
ncbi:unnamed protein product [Urochloa humidicola]